MRHALLIVMLPMILLLSGCCWDCSDEEEAIYDYVRVENHTFVVVYIRWNTGLNGKDLYEPVSSGGYLNIKLSRGSSIKADYNHVIHYYRVDAGSGSDPKNRTVIMEADDFVPTMPVANG